MRRLSILLGALFLARSAGAQAAGDAEIRKILADRIDAQKQSVGIVVGVVDSRGRRIVAHGTLERGGSRRVDGDTLFEIGSATKVFTALLLADMSRRGEVGLDDPIAKHLPSDLKLPEDVGRITLAQLAAHTSGLPRLPANLVPGDIANPYADYTPSQLYEFLSTAALTSSAGAEYEYSNLGAGLLGHLLERRAATDFETLVRRRIAEPLGMKSTVVTLTSVLQERMAKPHGGDLEPSSMWDFAALAGAGAFRSTANDLLSFLEVALGLRKSPLAPAFEALLSRRHETGMDATRIGLGWHVTRVNGREMVWHNGGTGGYRSFVGFDAKRRVGVVVLSNASTPAGVDDIGMHLLDRNSPLITARAEVAVDEKTLERYVGRYELAPEFVLTVTRQGTQLSVQATGQPNFEVYPSSSHEFFYKVVEARLTFHVEGEGKAAAVTLHQHGRSMPAKRIEGEVAARPSPREVAIDPAVLEAYVGRYQLAPDFVLTVTRDGSRLFVQATAQPKLEIFASSPREFFYKVVDARITFERDDTGRVTGLVLHQNGRNMPATRVDRP